MSTNAVQFGLLAMYAEDMYAAALGTLNPPADARIAADGWKVVGYLTAQDALVPTKGASNRKLGIDHGKRVFYGFVAQSLTSQTSYVAAIRGTEGMIEWVIDAEFVPIPHPRYPGARVEQGFWGHLSNDEPCRSRDGRHHFPERGGGGGRPRRERHDRCHGA